MSSSGLFACLPILSPLLVHFLFAFLETILHVYSPWAHADDALLSFPFCMSILISSHICFLMPPNSLPPLWWAVWRTLRLISILPISANSPHLWFWLRWLPHRTKLTLAYKIHFLPRFYGGRFFNLAHRKCLYKDSNTIKIISILK